MKKKNIVLVIFVTTLSAILLFLAPVFSNTSSDKVIKADYDENYIEGVSSELVIPTEEYLLSKGYPMNEKGETYGPNLGNKMLVEPDLILATGENGIVGYIYQQKALSSPSEVESYIPPKSTPLYLQDGDTIIGTFNYN